MTDHEGGPSCAVCRPGICDRGPIRSRARGVLCFRSALLGLELSQRVSGRNQPIANGACFLRTTPAGGVIDQGATPKSRSPRRFYSRPHAGRRCPGRPSICAGSPPAVRRDAGATPSCLLCVTDRCPRLGSRRRLSGHHRRRAMGNRQINRIMGHEGRVKPMLQRTPDVRRS